MIAAIASPKDVLPFLEYGQLGLAALMVLLGFYLSSTAGRLGKPSEMEHRRMVAAVFLRYSLAFLVISILAEVGSKFVPDHSVVNATIALPALQNGEAEHYGSIQIRMLSPGAKEELTPAAEHAQPFKVADNTNFTISLAPLMNKLAALQGAGVELANRLVALQGATSALVNKDAKKNDETNDSLAPK
jgi:type IV secretory pathway protease TraF